jgi:DNA-binding LytR/AlgR family response regulator
MKEKIAISIRRSVFPEDVMMIASESNYSKIYFSNQQSLVIAKTLKSLSVNFEKHISFVRTHKSFIVNRQFIKEISWAKPQAFIILTNNQRVAIARRNRLKVQDIFTEFL